jgi:hypothetical protein
MSPILSEYEIFFRNGSSFTVRDVRSIEIETNEDRTLKRLNIKGSNAKDKIAYLDISTISCILKRKEYIKEEEPVKKKRWWNK